MQRRMLTLVAIKDTNRDLRLWRAAFRIYTRINGAFRGCLIQTSNITSCPSIGCCQLDYLWILELFTFFNCIVRSGHKSSFECWLGLR